MQVVAYTTTLSKEYSVNGYKTSTFYNFLEDASPLPTSGDLRYRSTTYGLYNYGSGNRSATINIALQQDQLIVVDFRDTQSRNITVNSISDCTETSDYSGDNLKFYIVNNACSSINLNIGRAGCVLSVLVLDKDNSAATAKYTINYKFGDNIINSKTDNTTVGNTVNAESPITVDGQKYYAADGATTTFTVSSEEANNTFNVALRKAYEYTYTVTDNFDNTLATGKCTEGESVNGNYAQYKNIDGTLYEAPKASSNSYYKYSFIPTNNDYNHKIEYKATNINNVAYFAEGEDIEGMTATGNANADIRCSNGKGGFSSDAVTATTLQPGKYKATVVVWGGTGATFNVKAGEKALLSTETKGYLYSETSEEFELTENTPITISGGDEKGRVLDYIYITKTADVISLNSTYTYSTYCPTSDLDFTGVEDVEVYKAQVSVDKVVTTKVEGKVKAGEGIIIKNVNSVASVTVPTTTSAETLTDNQLVGALTEISDWTDKNAYMLVYDNGTYKFQKIGSGTLKAGKAYLNVPSEAGTKPSVLIFGDNNATAISGVAEQTETQNAAIYNLQGMKVEKAVKGLYIINGKKYVK